MFFLTLTFLVVLACVLVLIWNGVFFVSYSNDNVKQSPFECGFDPLSKMRSPFSTRFFLLLVLFLIFDIEIALLFPVLSAMAGQITTFLLLTIGLFLVILLGGMFHEWNEGALDWISS
uniref:NADH-ubiquinone oxidoreductase chain 3 n=1 Tax=Hermissenda emurai TaxID=1840523 RepID=A0A6H0N589_9GAST|nr:NADH dehydrogenase subunit 3 [Hermissenda emurai]QIV24375.1 NADH dehydrogenase subunit 3 [Hermissenda emurai]